MSKIKKRARRKEEKSAISPMMVASVTIAAVLIVVGLILLGNQSRQVTGSIDVSQFPALGEVEAPVTMIEYSDYGCGHCAVFALEKFDRLKTEYIDTGKVRYVAYPFNLGSPEMALATEAAWCAQDQGSYFDYKHALFANQGTMAMNQNTLTDLATSLGLDRNTFSACLANHTHQLDVENARRAATNRGVNVTPTFFINNQRVEGNQSYEYFQAIINQELAAAE